VTTGPTTVPPATSPSTTATPTTSTPGGVSTPANRAQPGERPNTSVDKAVRGAADVAVEDVTELGSAGFVGAAALPLLPSSSLMSTSPETVAATPTPAAPQAATAAPAPIRGWHALAEVAEAA
jgi:hypothetical protein